MTPFPTKFATALRAFFAQHLPLTRGLSPRTVLSYRDTFVLLLRFLAARHGCGVVDLELQHLRVGDVLAFLDHLETERKNSVATRNARLAAIHAFARFLATRDPEPVEECQRLLAVPTKRGPTRTVDYLEREEIGAMLEAVSVHRQDYIRDRALLLTLFNTGARVQELLDIRPGDLQLRSAHFRSSPRERTQGTPLSAVARDGGRTPKSAQCHGRRNYQPSFSQSPRRTDDQIRCSVSPAAFRRAGTDSSTYHRRQAHPSAYLSTQRCRSPPTCRRRSRDHQPLAWTCQRRDDKSIRRRGSRNQTQSPGARRARGGYCGIQHDDMANG